MTGLHDTMQPHETLAKLAALARLDTKVDLDAANTFSNRQLHDLRYAVREDRPGWGGGEIDAEVAAIAHLRVEALWARIGRCDKPAPATTVDLMMAELDPTFVS